MKQEFAKKFIIKAQGYEIDFIFSASDSMC